MIRVTRLDGSEVVINCELIETVERTPDSVLSIVSGRKLVVRESVEEITRRVIEYRKTIHQCPLLRGRIDPGALGLTAESGTAR